MKKFIVIVLVITVLLVSFFGLFHLGKVNQNRYYTKAWCEFESENAELVFTFDDNDFVWALDKGDKIPTTDKVVLVMDSNGTEEYSDDIIISYSEDK